MWSYPLETCLVSILGEPGWPLPFSLNDPLALILLGRCLPQVQHHGLHGRSLERASLLLPYLSSDFRCLFTHLLIAIATEDVFLFQVTTFRTNVYIVLKKKPTKQKHFNKRQHNAHIITDRNEAYMETFLECPCRTRTQDHPVQPHFNRETEDTHWFESVEKLGLELRSADFESGTFLRKYNSLIMWNGTPFPHPQKLNIW